RDAGCKHVVSPDQESEHGNRDERPDHERIAKKMLATEGREYFADDSKTWQNHDVYGGMGVEPEEMLVENWVSATGRAEEVERHREDTLEKEHDHSAGENRGCSQDQKAGDDDRPGKQRELKQRHAAAAHIKYGGQEVDCRHGRANAGKNDTDYPEIGSPDRGVDRGGKR